MQVFSNPFFVKEESIFAHSFPFSLPSMELPDRFLGHLGNWTWRKEGGQEALRLVLQRNFLAKIPDFCLAGGPPESLSSFEASYRYRPMGLSSDNGIRAKIAWATSGLCLPAEVFVFSSSPFCQQEYWCGNEPSWSWRWGQHPKDDRMARGDKAEPLTSC